MRRINFLYMLISGWASVCLLCLYQPFMKVWVGDKLMLPFGVVILMVLYFYILKMGDIRAVYSDAKGLWWENRYRTIMEAVSNIILNYTFVKRFGIYGIVIATIISLLVFGFLYSSLILFKFYFRNRIRQFLKDHLIYFSVTVMIAITTYCICDTYHGAPKSTLFFRMIVCIIIPIILYYFAYFKTKIFEISFSWIKERMAI